MQSYRLISWNVNGIRALAAKEILPEKTLSGFLIEEKPDILALQETKADARSIPSQIARIPDYFFYLNPAERKGYSGVALYSKIEPVSVTHGFGYPAFDQEGRVIRAEYPDFVLYNVYFPNGGASEERLAFKLKFYDAFLEYLKARDAAFEKIILCGDVNTAHTEEDLARPKENSTISGFLQIERSWIDRLLEAGFCDTFRLFTTGNGHYSWWDYKTKARSRNVGWRIDYFFVNERLKGAVTTSLIRNDIFGSDHCPVELSISL